MCVGVCWCVLQPNEVSFIISNQSTGVLMYIEEKDAYINIIHGTCTMENTKTNLHGYKTGVLPYYISFNMNVCVKFTISTI